VSAWITVSVIALLPVLLRTRKIVFTPLRVSDKDPWRLAGPYWRYKILTFTGYASDVGQRSDSYTTGTIGSSLGANGQVSSVRGSISTGVVVVDRFFLADDQGQAQSFQLSGFNAGIGEGHLVSVAWVKHGHAKKARYFMVHNHTTGQSFFSDSDIRKGITFPFPPLYVAALILMILPLAVLVPFGLVDIWQVRRFKRKGVRPLIEALAANAPGPPMAAPGVAGTVASQIKEIVALRDSGALTEPEFEAAKAKLLGA
jgi:hypothetical protein